MSKAPWEHEFWEYEASVLPLSGKYYGTVVDIGHTSVAVWGHAVYTKPSRRELDRSGFEGKEWDDLTPEEKYDIACDSHYETQADYDLALKIAALPHLLHALENLYLEAKFILEEYPNYLVSDVETSLTGVIAAAREAMDLAYGRNE